MRQVISCGVIVFREDPVRSFLLLRQPHRYDLPKGHVEEGEDEMSCALRELNEETSLPRELIEVDPGFRYSTTYYPRYRRFGYEQVAKTVVIYLAWLRQADHPIEVTEHQGHEWVPWQPPHRIERGTIDGVLAEVAEYLASNTPSK